MTKIHKRKRFDMIDVVVVILLTLWVLVIIIPFINAIAISFATQKEYVDNPLMLFPSEPTLKSYELLFNDYRIWTGFRTSFLLVLVGVPLNMLLTTVLAYGTSRGDYPGKKIIIGGILFTMLFNGGIIPLYLQMKELGLTNTIWSVVLAGTVNVFYFVIMRNYREDMNFYGAIIFSPNITDEEFQRAMDILDFCCTEEGQEIINMGFEGEDWELDENGEYVSLLPNEITGNASSILGSKYPSADVFFGGIILGDDFQFVTPNYTKETRDIISHFYELRDELSDETTLLPREYDYEFYSSRAKTQANMDLSEEYAQLILKDGDLETNWKNWVDEKMQLVQPLLDELNQQ